MYAAIPGAVVLGVLFALHCAGVDVLAWAGAL